MLTKTGLDILFKSIIIQVKRWETKPKILLGFHNLQLALSEWPFIGISTYQMLIIKSRKKNK